MRTINLNPSIPSGTDSEATKAARKARGSGKTSFNAKSVAERIQDAQEWQEGDADIKEARDTIQTLALSNPVSEFFMDPKQYISDAMDAGMVVPETVKKFADTDQFDLRLPQGDQRKIEKFMNALSQLGKGLGKKMKYIKKKKLFNHPEWYTKYSELVTQNLNWGTRKSSIGSEVMATGIQLSTALTIPMKDGKVAQSFIDAINIIYAKVRGSNSGSFTYDRVDIGAYIECIRCARALHKQLTRDFKLVNNVDPYISKTPDALLNIAGYNANGINEIKEQRANFINELALIGEQLKQRFPVPPQMSIFDRTEFVSEAILEEGKGPKSSVYIYRLSSLVTPGGNQSLVTVDVDLNTFTARLAILRQLMANMDLYQNPSYGNQPTFARIAGDILKAYGAAAFRDIEICTDLAAKATIQFDEYLLHQVQNSVGAAIASGDITTTASDIFNATLTQDVRINASTDYNIPTNSIYGVVDVNDVSSDVVMNTNKKDISGAEAISLTRLVCFRKTDRANSDIPTNSAINTTIVDCGTEVITAVRGYFYDTSDNFNRYGIKSCGNAYTPLMHMVSIWSEVDYAPLLQIYDESVPAAFDVLIDLDTYAFMSRRQFQEFNDIAVMSLYRTVDIMDQVNFKSVKR